MIKIKSKLLSFLSSKILVFFLLPLLLATSFSVIDPCFAMDEGGFDFDYSSGFDSDLSILEGYAASLQGIQSNDTIFSPDIKQAFDSLVLSVDFLEAGQLERLQQCFINILEDKFLVEYDPTSYSFQEVLTKNTGLSESLLGLYNQLGIQQEQVIPLLKIPHVMSGDHKGGGHFYYNCLEKPFEVIATNPKNSVVIGYWNHPIKGKKLSTFFPLIMYEEKMLFSYLKNYLLQPKKYLHAQKANMLLLKVRDNLYLELCLDRNFSSLYSTVYPVFDVIKYKPKKRKYQFANSLSLWVKQDIKDLLSFAKESNQPYAYKRKSSDDNKTWWIVDLAPILFERQKTLVPKGLYFEFPQDFFMYSAI